MRFNTSSVQYDILIEFVLSYYLAALYTHRWVRLDFIVSLMLAALAFGYMKGESDCTNILSNVSVPALKSCFIPLPVLSLHNPPI